MQPETQFILITLVDAPVAVMQFVTKSAEFETEATDEAVNAVIQKAGLTPVSWRRIDPSDVPSSRTFRAAWRDDGKTIAVDIDVAKDVVRAAIRAARNVQFAPLDIIISKLQTEAALGTLTPSDKQVLANTEAQRQKLRDAPANPAIDAAVSLDELAALLPTGE